MQNQETSDYYSVKELQKKLGIGKNAAYALIKSPGFPCYTIGRKNLIPKKEFETWEQKQLRKQTGFHDFS